MHSWPYVMSRHLQAVEIRKELDGVPRGRDSATLSGSDTVRKAIQRELQNRNWTYSDLALAVSERRGKISPSKISRFMTGSGGSLDADDLAMIAPCFGRTAAQLLMEPGEAFNTPEMQALRPLMSAMDGLSSWEMDSLVAVLSQQVELMRSWRNPAGPAKKVVTPETAAAYKEGTQSISRRTLQLEPESKPPFQRFTQEEAAPASKRRKQ